MDRMQDCLKAGTICLNSFWGIYSSELGKHGVVEVRAPAGPGEMILQRGMISRMVLCKGKFSDQVLRPARQIQSKEGAERDSRSGLDCLKRDQKLVPDLQRHSIEGAERDFWSCLSMVSRNRTLLKLTFYTVLRQPLLS